MLDCMHFANPCWRKIIISTCHRSEKVVISSRKKSVRTRIYYSSLYCLLLVVPVEWCNSSIDFTYCNANSNML